MIHANKDLKSVTIAESFQNTPVGLLEGYVLKHIKGFKADTGKLQKVREAISQSPGLELALAYIKGGKNQDAGNLLTHFERLANWVCTPPKKKMIADMATSGKITDISSCEKAAKMDDVAMEAAKDKHWNTVLDSFEKGVKQYLKGHPDTLKKVLDQFNAKHKESDFSLQIKNFTRDALHKKQIKPRPMQSAAALSALALLEQKVNCILKIGTGEGKSLIMSMVTHLAPDKEHPIFDNVVIVYPTGVLNAQAATL